MAVGLSCLYQSRKLQVRRVFLLLFPHSELYSFLLCFPPLRGARSLRECFLRCFTRRCGGLAKNSMKSSRTPFSVRCVRVSLNVNRVVSAVVMFRIHDASRLMSFLHFGAASLGILFITSFLFCEMHLITIVCLRFCSLCVWFLILILFLLCARCC